LITGGPYVKRQVDAGSRGLQSLGDNSKLLIIRLRNPTANCRVYRYETVTLWVKISQKRSELGILEFTERYTTHDNPVQQQSLE
jgi:hypothetical protein